MTIKEAINRGNNLAMISIVTLAGFAFAPEILLEDDPADKIDDILLLLLGIVAIIWYRKGQNRFMHSVMPVILVYASLAVKIMAIMIEVKDKEAVGDDFGALVLFVLSALFATFLYRNAKKLLSEK